MKTYFETVSELLEGIAEVDGQTKIMSCNKENSRVTPSIWAAKRAFFPKTAHFTDSFDHELYKRIIYIPDEDGEPCVRLYEEKPEGESAEINDIAALREYLKGLPEDDILIGTSYNFEHEGFVTKGVHFWHNTKNSTVTLEYYMKDEWRK